MTSAGMIRYSIDFGSGHNITILNMAVSDNVDYIYIDPALTMSDQTKLGGDNTAHSHIETNEICTITIILIPFLHKPESNIT